MSRTGGRAVASSSEFSRQTIKTEFLDLRTVIFPTFPNCAYITSYIRKLLYIQVNLICFAPLLS